MVDDVDTTDLRTRVPPGRDRFGFIAILFLILGALTGARQPGIGPNGDGTLLADDDQHWSLLQRAKIIADTEKGEYRAVFAPVLSRADGMTLRLSGYMLPVETASRSNHFVITRRSMGCPFCAPPELTEAVEVFASTPVRYTINPVALRGRLHLISRTETGLFYRLESAAAE